MKRILQFLICIITLNIFAQKEANIWYFGENAGIDFNQSPPVALTDGRLNTLEGCSSFSDVNGNLLFYSDGIEVYDRTHTLMTYTNGALANNLRGNPSSTQSGMIIPKPGDPTIFYLFTVDDGPNGNTGEPGLGLNLYTIDMSLNAGNGQLIDENNDGVFYTDLSNGRNNQWTEKVAAVRGDECNTYWVVSAVDNAFYTFKVDASGVNTTPIISFVSNSADRRGYLKLSPDGSKLAIANQSSSAFMYSFDNQSGLVSDDGIRLISGTSNDGEPYGVEFSSDSSKLYISTVSRFRQTLNEPAASYKLFQFDLNDTDIPNSKGTPIHQQIANSTQFPQGGFRGALQLGPDGKIYATIPLAYNDPNPSASPNGDAPFLDVIENPNAPKTQVVFRKNAIDLNGRFATQGLPPFISSLLLPIEIIDISDNQVINNQNLEYCAGESITISPEAITGNNITYEWSFGDGISSSVISNTSSLSLNNISSANNGVYGLTVNLTDDCGNLIKFEGTFSITVFEPANANSISDIFFCDTDGDGFNTFDFQTNVTPIVLGSQDPTSFEVLYFLSQNDADSNTNVITNPYTNPSAFSSQDIYVRVHNRQAVEACYDITNFRLVITGLPTPVQPQDYEECDDLINGGDTDGFYNTYVLSSKDNEILGSLSPTQYSVSYHTTLSGAQTSSSTDVIDKMNPYRNTTINEQTVYVRVENVDNVDCVAVSDETSSTFKPFKLIVNALPTIANNPALLRQCDTDSDLTTTINLTQAQINISTNSSNETFKYYTSQSDADSDTDEITNPTAYSVSDGDTVWARTISSEGCFRVSQIDITVSFAGDITYDRLFEECDDFLDADGNDSTTNSDADGITFFDISQAEDDVKSQFPPTLRPNLDVLFFETLGDRDAVVNEIPDLANYRNTNLPATTQQPIYIKIVNTVNNDCTGIGQLYIFTQPVPSSTVVTDIIQCDDFDSGSFTDGENSAINLRDQVPSILGNQSSSDFTVTFHTSNIDAESGTNPITNDTNFRNTAQAGFNVGDISEQTIYVRVQNNSTSCANPHESFKVIINPLPLITTNIDPLEVCDTGRVDNNTRNGLEQQINLSVKDPEVLDGRDPALFEVSYHRTQQDAMDGIAPFNKTNYSNNPATTTIFNNEGQETIWISLLDTATGCRYGANSLLIRVYPEPNILLTDISNLSDCDTDDDSDSTNGLIQNIDLTVQEPDILSNYPTGNHDDFSISYHITQNGATTNTDIISDSDKVNYANTSNPQRIYIRVENKDTGCINDDTYFDIIINPLPDFVVTSPQIVCLNEAPITLQVENPNGNYVYEWTKDNDPTVVSTTSELIVDVAGVYYVTATNTSTTPQCQRTRLIRVNASSIADIKEDDVVVVDDSDNNSITILTDNNNLGVGDYEFALLNEIGLFIKTYQDEPYFEGLDGGIYTILVRDKNNCGIAELEVSIIEFPKFFTPNNDGYNDTWTLKGVNATLFPTSSIYIFDRFGKLITEIPINGDGWDGTYNGNPMPSSDYWFNIQIVDQNGTVRTKKGHFSLLRK